MKIKTKEELARVMDYSILPKQTVEKEILEGCALTRKYRFAAFYTSSSYWTPLVVSELAGFDDVEIGIGVAFPFGTAPLELKMFEIEQAIERGCTAIDLVLNIGAVKSKKFTEARTEIEKFAEVCRGRAVSKCILEVCYLSDEEIKTVCEMVRDAKIDYAKTSTGQFEGPSLQQVLLMRKTLENSPVKLKVSGVKSPRPQNAIAFLQAGASRIGTRAAVEIVESWDSLVEAGLID
ncbi:MAG: deoxyribose-phosphate aldolase [Thermoguttaceae bacterium]